MRLLFMPGIEMSGLSWHLSGASSSHDLKTKSQNVVTCLSRSSASGNHGNVFKCGHVKLVIVGCCQSKTFLAQKHVTSCLG